MEDMSNANRNRKNWSRRWRFLRLMSVRMDYFDGSIEMPSHIQLFPKGEEGFLF